MQAEKVQLYNGIRTQLAQQKTQNCEIKTS